MIVPESIQDRIRTLDLFTKVGDIVDAAEEMQALQCRPPAAFVGIESETASRANLTGVHDQRIATSIAVVFVVRTQRSAARRQDEIARFRGQLIANLSGWKPEGAVTALDYKGFRVIGVLTGFIWVQVNFVCEWRQRVVPNP